MCASILSFVVRTFAAHNHVIIYFHWKCFDNRGWIAFGRSVSYFRSFFICRSMQFQCCRRVVSEQYEQIRIETTPSTSTMIIRTLEFAIRDDCSFPSCGRRRKVVGRIGRWSKVNDGDRRVSSILWLSIVKSAIKGPMTRFGNVKTFAALSPPAVSVVTCEIISMRRWKMTN